MKTRNLIVGYDLCSDYSQISCYNEKKREPESICSLKDQMLYQIPTVLFKHHISGEWVYGKEALWAAENEPGDLIRDFLIQYDHSETIEVNGNVYEKRQLLKVFITQTLKMLEPYYPVHQIVRMTITTPNINRALIEDVKHLGEEELLKDTDIALQSHVASYQYYALSQDKELWQHDVGLFEYDRHGLTYHHLEINRKHMPAVASVTSTPLTAYLKGESYKTCSPPELDRRFVEIVRQMMSQRIISTIYLCGEGFDGDWMKLSLKTLCMNRRVFKGQNLYAKGACYSSLLVDIPVRDRPFLALNDDIISKQVYIKGSTNKETVGYELAEVGAYWHEIDKTIEFILDKTDTIGLYIRDFVTKKVITVPVRVDVMPDRQDRNTRIKMHVRFESPDICYLELQDNGFGALFPATGKIWRRRININEYDGDEMLLEKGRLIISKPLEDKAPYYFSISGVKVYDVCELCYYIKNNIFSIDMNLFDEEFFYWLERHAQEPKLSRGLRNLKKTGPALKEMLRYLMTYVDYYTNEECHELMRQIDELERQNPVESLKTQADNLVTYKKFVEAVRMYHSVIYQMEDELQDVVITRDFKGNVYHNLGAVYARLLNFRAASECFKKAFELNHDSQPLKNYLWTLKLLNDETAFFDAVGFYNVGERLLQETLDEFEKMQEKVSGLVSEVQDIPEYIGELKEWYRT